MNDRIKPFEKFNCCVRCIGLVYNFINPKSSKLTWFGLYLRVNQDYFFWIGKNEVLPGIVLEKRAIQAHNSNLVRWFITKSLVRHLFLIRAKSDDDKLCHWGDLGLLSRLLFVSQRTSLDKLISRLITLIIQLDFTQRKVFTLQNLTILTIKTNWCLWKLISINFANRVIKRNEI